MVHHFIELCFLTVGCGRGCLCALFFQICRRDCLAVTTRVCLFVSFCCTAISQRLFNLCTRAGQGALCGGPFYYYFVFHFSTSNGLLTLTLSIPTYLPTQTTAGLSSITHPPLRWVVSKHITLNSEWYHHSSVTYLYRPFQEHIYIWFMCGRKTVRT